MQSNMGKLVTALVTSLLAAVAILNQNVFMAMYQYWWVGVAVITFFLLAIIVRRVLPVVGAFLFAVGLYFTLPSPVVSPADLTIINAAVAVGLWILALTTAGQGVSSRSLSKGVRFGMPVIAAILALFVIVIAFVLYDSTQLRFWGYYLGILAICYMLADSVGLTDVLKLYNKSW